jgi:hypothetical protein
VIEVIFVVGLEDAVGEGEGEEFLEFGGGALLEPGAKALVGGVAGLGIEQDVAGLGEELGGVVNAVAEELGDGIAGLVLERQLLLPPDEELAAVLLDLLAAGV